MADAKITAFTALTGANSASGDVFPIVDISDTTMDASGTNKSMTRNELGVAVGLGQLLASSLLASSATTMDFTSLPQTFLHLRIIAEFRTDRASNVQDDVLIAFNNDTTNANYSLTQNVDAPTTGNERFLAHAAGATATTNGFATNDIMIPNYTGTSKLKQGMNTSWCDGSTWGFLQLTHLRWANTAAISRITFAPRNGTNLVAGSYVGIYGIAG